MEKNNLPTNADHERSAADLIKIERALTSPVGKQDADHRWLTAST
jgi:hypothetical protein